MLPNIQPGFQLGVNYWRQPKELPVPKKASCGVYQSHPEEKSLPGSKHAVNSSSTAGQPTHDPPSWMRQLLPLLEPIRQKECLNFPQFLLRLGVRLQARLSLGAAGLRF